MQYSISNLNAFIILVSIGFSLYYLNNSTQEYKELDDKNNSPVQLISQLKGYFYINPYLALSLTITIGFFAKQMVLSAALDSGYVFISLVAILTSVIGAVYYLNIIKQIFFDSQEYNVNTDINSMSLQGSITKKNKVLQNLTFKINSVVLSKSLTITISILTLLTLLFIFMPDE
jgi:NADH-ubiquinone oxidoreductase chain 2